MRLRRGRDATALPAQRSCESLVVLSLSFRPYCVGRRPHGQHALTQLQEQSYDVIVCDLHMPDLDGPAFYAILIRQYPALRQWVIFLTGDTGGTATRTFLTQCGRPWLPKPCPIAAIRHVIASVPRMAPPLRPPCQAS